MERVKKNTGKYWLGFFISLAFMILVMALWTQWFWLVLPFVCTFFALGMDFL